MEYVEVARAASERGELVLRERHESSPCQGPAGAAGADTGPAVLELRVNGVFVMDTRETSTERALATAALERVARPRSVLVGGLGLGFTAHEVLADPRVERLVVVEIEDALVQWMRDGTVPHGPGLLADDRLSVQVADVRVALAEARPAGYDLVLLDVDNGPGFLVHEANAAIYRRDFLVLARTALRPDGALTVWSSAEAPALAEEMRAVFGHVEPVAYDVRLQGRDEHYWLYVAREPGAQA